MKEVIFNEENLKEEEMNQKVYRARGLIINSKNKILLGHCENTYQFPGGFLEEGETLKEGLKREIAEETGINIEIDEIPEPFFRVKYYNRDYPNSGINRYTEFDYFLIKTDKEYDLNNLHLDDWEYESDFKLEYVPISLFVEKLESGINSNPKNKLVYADMIKAFNIMQDMYKL